MKVLHVIPGIYYGGIEQVVIRYTNNSVHDHHVITLSSESTSQTKIFKQKFKSVTLNESSHFYGKYKFICRFLKNNSFDVIHIHLNEISGFLVAMIYRNFDSKKIIVHCHNFYRKEQESAYIKIGKLFTRFITRYLDCKKLSCTKEAGNWLFKKNYHVVKNAFKLNAFKAEESNYKKNIKFIARLEPQKDPMTALSIYSKYFKDEYKMEFIGSGSLSPLLKDSIENINHIEIKEPQQNVKKLILQTDILVAPSKYEGLGLIVLEAYCSGCIVIVSKGYPEDVTSLPGSIMVDEKGELDEEQLRRINTMLGRDRIQRSKENIDHIKSLGYSIEGRTFDEYY